MTSSRFRKNKNRWNYDMWLHQPNNNNNNNNNIIIIIYLLHMGCYPVAVITLHVFPNTDNKFT
jgi:hypothetical protein